MTDILDRLLPVQYVFDGETPPPAPGLHVEAAATIKAQRQELHDLRQALTESERLLAAAYSSVPSPEPEPPPHHDDVSVALFASAMRRKMEFSRKKKARKGWETMPRSVLWSMLREHVDKGDPIDVANFCMMVWNLDQHENAPHRRGTGRTKRQIMAAPAGALFLAHPDTLSWVRLMTQRIVGLDLEVASVEALDAPDMIRSLSREGVVVVDHYAYWNLTLRQYDTLVELQRHGWDVR